MTEEETMNAIEAFEERAAIREYEAGQPRLNAESGALREVVERYGKEAGRAVQRHRGLARD